MHPVFAFYATATGTIVAEPKDAQAADVAGQLVAHGPSRERRFAVVELPEEDGALSAGMGDLQQHLAPECRPILAWIVRTGKLSEREVKRRFDAGGPDGFQQGILGVAYEVIPSYARKAAKQIAVFGVQSVEVRALDVLEECGFLQPDPDKTIRMPYAVRDYVLPLAEVQDPDTKARYVDVCRAFNEAASVIEAAADTINNLDHEDIDGEGAAVYANAVRANAVRYRRLAAGGSTDAGTGTFAEKLTAIIGGGEAGMGLAQPFRVVLEQFVETLRTLGIGVRIEPLISSWKFGVYLHRRHQTDRGTHILTIFALGGDGVSVVAAGNPSTTRIDAPTLLEGWLVEFVKSPVFEEALGALREGV